MWATGREQDVKMSEWRLFTQWSQRSVFGITSSSSHPFCVIIQFSLLQHWQNKWQSLQREISKGGVGRPCPFFFLLHVHQPVTPPRPLSLIQSSASVQHKINTAWLTQPIAGVRIGSIGVRPAEVRWPTGCSHNTASAAWRGRKSNRRVWRGGEQLPTGYRRCPNERWHCLSGSWLSPASWTRRGHEMDAHSPCAWDAAKAVTRDFQCQVPKHASHWFFYPECVIRKMKCCCSQI